MERLHASFGQNIPMGFTPNEKRATLDLKALTPDVHLLVPYVRLASVDVKCQDDAHKVSKGAGKSGTVNGFKCKGSLRFIKNTVQRAKGTDKNPKGIDEIAKSITNDGAGGCKVQNVET